MNKTRWIIFIGVVVAIFAGVIFFNKNNTSNNFKGDPAKIINDGPIADYVFGSRDQKVTLIEYGDYECPGCGSIYGPLKSLTEKYKDKVTFIFREFPLTSIHPNALAAATAAEAAGLQGKYYEMHDKLYENQDAWGQAQVSQREAIFTGYASDIGLNVDKFKSDLTSTNISDKISRDRSTGLNNYKINGTPTFILNGTTISGQNAVSIDSITKKVEEAIKYAYPNAN